MIWTCREGIKPLYRTCVPGSCLWPSIKGMDGIQWVLEGVRNHEYHVADRLSPKDSDFARVCIFLMTLTPINLEKGGEKQTNSPSPPD